MSIACYYVRGVAVVCARHSPWTVPLPVARHLAGDRTVSSEVSSQSPLVSETGSNKFGTIKVHHIDMIIRMEEPTDF